MKVLIIEDDPATADIITRRLEKLDGVEIIKAATMKDAMRIMRDEIPPPEMVFLDIFLPDSHVAELTLAHVKKMKEINPDVIVLVMTGLHLDSMHDLAIAMGADAFEFKHDIGTHRSFFNAMRKLLLRQPAGRERAESLCDLLEQITAIVSTNELAASNPAENHA